MLTIVYIFCVILIILMGYIYINAVNKVNKADMATRNAGSDIDTCLWDMTHNLGIIIKALKEIGIEPELPPDQSILLTVGTSVASQQQVILNTEERMAVVRPELENAGLTELDPYKVALQKYDNARTEIVSAGMKYNNSVGKYNATIAHFPANFIASRKSKGPKMIFAYQPNNDKKA